MMKRLLLLSFFVSACSLLLFFFTQARDPGTERVAMVEHLKTADSPHVSVAKTVSESTTRAPAETNKNQPDSPTPPPLSSEEDRRVQAILSAFGNWLTEIEHRNTKMLAVDETPQVKGVAAMVSSPSVNDYSEAAKALQEMLRGESSAKVQQTAKELAWKQYYDYNYFPAPYRGVGIFRRANGSIDGGLFNMEGAEQFRVNGEVCFAWMTSTTGPVYAPLQATNAELSDRYGYLFDADAQPASPSAD